MIKFHRSGLPSMTKKNKEKEKRARNSSDSYFYICKGKER
jgi:RIO-like serine/threonine protein kinase